MLNFLCGVPAEQIDHFWIAAQRRPRAIEGEIAEFSG